MAGAVAAGKQAAPRGSAGKTSRQEATSERAPRADVPGLQHRMGNRALATLIQRSAGGAPLIQRCACGGTCAKCSGHDDEREDLVQRLRAHDVQPKLTVNQVGDPYEIEADRVADQVMRMRAPAPPAAAPGITPVARASAERAQRREADEEEERDEDEIEGDLVQRRARVLSSPGITPKFESALRAGEGSGAPLPAPTRSFFEERMGRDLGAVRVHRGSASESLNDAIQARAFTHRNHVWLGPGLGTEPSHVLAHELVHVVQQTGGRSIARKAAPAVSANRDGPSVQRFAPYWEPYDYNGTRTHNEVLPALSRHANVFVEAPVPNADRLSADFDKRGIADIYDADRTVGVFFSGDQRPARLGASGRLRSDGGEYAHSSLAAPRLGRGNTLTHVDAAPASIAVADLKPSHGTIEALEGETQVRHYLAGFELAARETNEMSDNSRVRPAGGRWNPATSLISGSRLQAMIPPRYRPGSTDQQARNLILKQNARPIRPFIQSTGRLVVLPDPTNLGIVNYVWVPGTPLSVPLPPSVLALGEEVRLRILNPLRTAPVRNSIRETFDLGEWRTQRARIRREFRGARRTPEVRTAESAAKVVEAAQATVSSTGLSVASPAAQTVTTARAMERVEFWTSIPAGVFGTFRRIFGRVFVRVYQAYERMRERFGGWLRRRRAPSGGGGLTGAAIKVAFSLLKMAGVWVLNRTMSLLQQSLVEGLTRKLTTLIPEENMEELRGRVTEVQQLRDRMQQQAIDTAEAIIDRIFPGYQQHMDEIQTVMSIVSGISRVISIIRWGIRAISCVSPPAVGCLWGLAITLSEELLALVIQTCAVQRRIAPIIAATSWVRELPRTLARNIITVIRGMLPEGLHDVFSDVSSSAPSADEIECDDSEGGGRPLTDDQEAVLDLQDRLGEERFTAMLQMLRGTGVNPGTPLNRALAERLGRFVEENRLTAEEMRRLASLPRGSRTVPLERLLEQLRSIRERSPVRPIPPPPPRPPAPEAGAEEGEGAPEYRTVVVAPRGGSAEAEAGASGGDEELTEELERELTEQPTPPPEPERVRSDVREARARPVEEARGPRVSGWNVRIARVRGSLTEGATVHLDIRMARSEAGRRIVRMLRDLECVVTEVAPSEERPGTTEAFLEVTRTQEFRFATGERYGYPEGREFIHRFTGVGGAR